MIGLTYRNLTLNGSWTIRVVTLSLPTRRVRAMLPPGLELGPQRSTRPGTHPVRLYFASPMSARMSVWPEGSFGMDDYREHVVGVPFVHRSGSPVPGCELGPFYFVPRILVDNWGSALGGNMFWAFEKQLVQMQRRPGLFRVLDLYEDRPLVDIRWRPDGPWRPARLHHNFGPSRQMMDQPLTFRTLWSATFSMQWATAMVRSVRSRVQIYEPYSKALPPGRFDAVGLDRSIIGSHELRVKWTTSLPYYPEFRPMLRALGGRV